jgi:flagellar basal-body rod protein FlgG
MQTGYYSAAAGMVTQFNRLDTISNNLANVNTNGFKEDDVVVGDFMRLYQQKRDELPNGDNTKEAAKFLNRAMAKVPQVVEGYTDYSVGNMQKTSNQLDLALSNEDLFFVVKTPQGIRLTRDGSFSLSDEGKLITKEGYEVLGDDYFKSKDGISFAATDNVINIDKNGQIYTNIPGSTKLTENKKLFIASVDDLKYLQKEGDNLYKIDDMDRVEMSGESGAVKQGFLEKSNVNAVKMMTELIETNRLVGMYQKAMDTQMNDMNRDAIEKLAKKA